MKIYVVYWVKNNTWNKLYEFISTQLLVRLGQLEICGLLIVIKLTCYNNEYIEDIQWFDVEYGNYLTSERVFFNFYIFRSAKHNWKYYEILSHKWK